MAVPTQQGVGHVEFINDQERQYFAEAMVGEDVRSFLNSTAGIYLHGRAKQVYAQCQKELFEIDPYTPEGKKTYERIRREAWCAQQFLRWCAEAIMDGQNAATQLESYRES